MAVTNGWGQGAVNNTIDWGKGEDNATNSWGKVYDVSSSGDTNITGSGGTPAFVNTKSIELDGVDDFVNCGDSDNLSFGNGSTDSPFSISAWIKPNDNQKFRIIFKYNPTQTLREYFFQVSNSSKLQVGLYDANNLGSLGRNGNTTIPENVWSHVAMTYNGNGSNTGIKIYLNGALDNGSTSGGGSYTAMNNTTEPFLIGKFNGGSTANGLIDETAIFNTELSASDVTDIYGSGVPSSLSSYSSLISWWRCGDGDTSPTLTDNGSGGNNGTMTNFSTFSTDVPIELFSKKSILLDGVDDFADMGNPTSLQITGAMTLSAWVKTTASGASDMLIGKDGVSAGTRTFLFLRSSNNAKFGIFKSGSFVSVTGTSAINDGNWHHVMGVNTGTDLKIYVDGNLEATNAGGGGTIDNGTGIFYLGRRGGSPAQRLFYTGHLDEVAVWNSDQSSNASAIYGTGTPTDLSIYSPISWWRCGDGDTSPTLTDNGSGGNNGTMTNFSTFSTDVPT